MSPAQVVVTGIGLLTPLGDRAADVHRRLCAGERAIAPLTSLDGEGIEGIEGIEGGELSGFDAADYLGRRGLRGMDRSSRLSATAAALALADAGRSTDGVATGEIGLVLGTMLSGVRTTSRFDRRAVTAGPSYAKPMDFANTVINASAGQSAIRLGLRGLNATVSSGAASGLQAIGYAVDLIRAGRAEALLAGGMDELSWESVLAFRGSGLLAGNGTGAPRHPYPCDRRRNGFAPGEAAAFLLLEREEAAHRRGAEVLAEIRGHGTCFVPAGHGDGSRGVELAVTAALDDARLDPEALGALSVGANGSASGDLAEARGLHRVLGERLRDLPVTATKGALGESLGASGAVATALLVQALGDSTLPGIAGCEHPDPQLPYAGLTTAARPLGAACGLVSARGLEGKSSALVLASPVERAA